MTTIYNNRLYKVYTQMVQSHLDALIISDPQSIWYLTGVWNEPYERMYVLLLEINNSPAKNNTSKSDPMNSDLSLTLFANKLFSIPSVSFPVIWFTDTDNGPLILSKQMSKSGTIGVDKVWPARFLVPLQSLLPNDHFVIGSDCVDNARACKDAEEQRLMKEASHINDSCIQKGFAFVKKGITEKEVAAYIDAQFVAEGAECPSFETIVSFGANAADPHHSPDNTIVQEGDCVLIDMGCKKNRYCSDMTRTNFFHNAPQQFAAIHDLVRSANEAAEAMIHPGVRFCDIDKTARDIISSAGYGEYFTHRLGHFIGQSDHEQGDVSSANTTCAKEGMIFSIEPGVYLPGKFGVRVEDLVLVTAAGCEILNHVDKKWKLL